MRLLRSKIVVYSAVAVFFVISYYLSYENATFDVILSQRETLFWVGEKRKFSKECEPERETSSIF